MEDYAPLKILLKRRIPVIGNPEHTMYSHQAFSEQGIPFIIIEKRSRKSKYARVVFDLTTSIFYLRVSGLYKIKEVLDFYRAKKPDVFLKSDTYYSFTKSYSMGPYMELSTCKEFAEDIKTVITSVDHVISFFEFLKESKIIK